MGSQKMIRTGIGVLSISLLLVGCGGEPSRKIEPVQQTPVAASKVELITTPEFSGESAYQYVQKQVDFGPRVPNTATHKACSEWLEEELDRLGWKTNVQKATVTAYNDDKLSIYNIMGQWNPEAKKRILLSAHWDTRPYADRDVKDRNKPIDGANDGASGVGVLLELARVLSEAEDSLNIGIDVVFFDAEDYGKPQSSMIGNQASNTWALGSQYWSKNLPIAGYKAEYGILLDMVGASSAVFPREYYSLQYAPAVVDKVWEIAHAMGHKDYFSNMKGNPVIDDHLFVNQNAGIPMIDIIHYDMFRNDFGHFHHTHEDNMEVIDANTLAVVGDVVLQVLYQENAK